MVSLMQLPTFSYDMGRRSSLLDLSPINQAIGFGAQLNQNNIANARADRQVALAEKADARQQSMMDEDMRRKRIGDIGRLAQAALDEQDPAKRIANAQKLLTIPGVADKFKSEGIDVSDPITAARHISALAGTYIRNAELEKEKLGLEAARQGITAGDLDIQAKRRDLAAPSLKTMIVPEGATAIGINPRTGEHQVLAQGERKIDATTKKAIDEADEFAAQNKTAVDLIDKAIALNSKANAGFGASARATLANNLPDALVPNIVSSPESGQATVDLDNLVTSQALQSLRSTFGANPTEGERQILMEVAGSVNMPREARARIYQRAREAAQSRLERNTEKARALRAGTYFTPNYQPGKPQDNLTGTQNTNEAAVKQKAEAQRVINGKTYYKIGGQWYESGN